VFNAEREIFIIEKLKKQGRVLVNDLAEELDVTPMTIRRDLQKLDEQGVLQKVHGGAVLLDGMLKERAYGEKKLIQTSQKRMIAGEAMRLVNPGDTILLDAGTTTFEMASLLRAMPGVSVVTNDLHIALELCNAEGKLFFIGGEIEKELARSTGAKAHQFLSDIHVDTVFLGISSISGEFMLGSHTIDNAELKRDMLKCGSKRVLLADKSKFGIKAFAQIGPLNLVDILITDKTFNDRDLKYFETENVMLRQVQSD
jgi:DeoR family transcriptional regulator, fructose operon transcriptional repressor